MNMASRFQLILAIVFVTTAAIAAAVIRTWPWPLHAAKRAREATVAAYVAFAVWAWKAGGVGTLAISGLLIFAGWLFGLTSLVASGLQVFAQGTMTLLVIGLPFALSWMGRSDLDNCKAPQGLPSVELAQREADEVVHLEWSKENPNHA